MEDRRKLPRKYLMAFSSVKDDQTGLHLGFLCDLNTKGLMIICKKPLEIGQGMQLYIDLPEDKNFRQKSILLNAKAVWCEEDIDPRLYNTGFEIVDVAENQKDIIEKMIDLYEFQRGTTTYPPENETDKD